MVDPFDAVEYIILPIGHPGIQSSLFYVNIDENSSRAVIECENAAAWIGPYYIAMGWPEMQGLHAVAWLSEVTFLDKMTPEDKSWIDQSLLTAKSDIGNVHAAGFRR